MQSVKTTAQRVASYTKTHKTYIALGIGGFFVLLYGVAFFIPKPVQFLYSNDSCVRQLTLFPSVHSAPDESKYEVSFRDEAKIGSVSVASMKTCFTAAASPDENEMLVSTAPFGGIFARKHFNVKANNAPKPDASVFAKALPVSKPLTIALSETDHTFSYTLKADNSEASCVAESRSLSCDVPALKLKQGKTYKLWLARSFKQAEAAKVLEADVKTLKAVKITKSSLKQEQTVYAKPKSFVFTTDKPLESAEAKLELTSGDNKPVETTTAVEGTKITVRLKNELAREKSYRVTLSDVEAQDGSTFVEPYKVNFKMSGGPNVTNVSVGSSKVATSAQIILTFDQEIGSDAVVKKFIKFSGGAATVAKLSSRQVAIQLNGMPKCQPLTIIVDKGLTSRYNIASSSAWRFNSRTLCHSTGVYGTSVQGRPLVAYYFGNSGPTTMYVGAIHGNESSSSGLMQSWIDELEANPSKWAGKQLVIVPTINPDGLTAGTRTNSRNVNLNRNFPTGNWVSDIDDTDGKHKGGGGKKPLSEPEAAALASLTTNTRPRLLLSFHAVGSLVVGDPGGYSAGYASRYASLAGYRDATGSSSDTFDYNITGAYEEWSYQNLGIPSMVIELGSYSYHSLDNHRAALWAMLQ